MNTISDNEIHQIVQQVLKRLSGLPQPATPPSPQPVPAPSPHPIPLPTPSSAPSGSQTPQAKKIVAIGADHGGFELKETLKAALTEMDYDVRDMGTYTKVAVDYPDFAHIVAKQVATGKAWRGIMIDGAGIGSCIVANKVPGVRAGMAYDLSSASNSREHNDTNVLTLGAGLIGAALAKQIVKVWLETPFGGGRHQPRIDKITAVEKQYLK